MRFVIVVLPAPVVPFGFILNKTKDFEKIYMFFEIIDGGQNDGGKADGITFLPEGDYECIQKNIRPKFIHEAVMEVCKKQEFTAVISNMPKNAEWEIERKFETQFLPDGVRLDFLNDATSASF